MLYFPLWHFPLWKARLNLKCRFLLLLWFLLMMDLDLLRFANSLMFTNSVRQKFPAASSTGDEICVLIAVVVFFFLKLICGRFAINGFFLLFDYAQRAFVNVRLFYHWAFLTRLLMRNQRFWVELSRTIFALNQGLLDECIERIGVKLVDIIASDLILGYYFVEWFGGLRTRSSLLGWFEVLLIFPLLLTGFDMDG